MAWTGKKARLGMDRVIRLSSYIALGLFAHPRFIFEREVLQAGNACRP